MRTEILFLVLALLVTIIGVVSTADSTGKMLKYKGTQSVKVGKKTYKCAFNIAYTSTACIKKTSTVKCKPNTKKLTLKFPQIDADDANLDVTVAKNKIKTCKVASTMIPTIPAATTPLPHPGPGLEERLEAMEAQIRNLTTALETSISSISSKISTNMDKIGTNKDNIGTNKDNIGTNKDTIGTNTDNIGTNKDIIGTNKDNITTNSENIAKLESCLADVDSSECPISQNGKTSSTITANTETTAQFHTQQFNLVVTGGTTGTAWQYGPWLATSEVISSQGVCNSSIPPLPVAIRAHQSVYFNGGLMVCGGYGNSAFQKNCYLLKDSGSHWTVGPQLNQARAWFTLIKAGDDVYAIGGEDNGGFFDSMEKLNINANKWTIVPQKMTSPRGEYCGVLFDNELVIMGGWTPSTNKVESFNLLTGQWKELAPLPISSLWHHRCVILDGFIYVSGGRVPNFQKQVYKYNNGAWETVGELTGPREYHTMDVLDGKLLIVGGWNGGENFDSIETTEDDGKFKKLTWNLSEARYSHSMAVVPNDDFPCL